MDTSITDDPIDSTLEYIIVPFQIDSHGVSRDELETLFDSLLAHFSNANIKLVQSNGGYDIHLREISWNKLETAITLTKNGNPLYDRILDSFVAAIDGVRSFGLKGDKRVYVGYNKERKVTNRKDKESNRGTYFYAKDAPYITESKSLSVDLTDKIICGDSEIVMQDFPENCVDLIFTSPPYNFGLEYDSQNDADAWERYFQKLFGILDQCIRVLKYGGRLVINIQPLYSDYIPSHHIISNFLMERKLIWKGEILWEKNNYNCKYTAWGSWKSPSSPYLKYTWEFIEVFCKGTLKKEGKLDDADISVDEFKKWVVGKWSIAPERKMQEFDHPAMFPEELARRALLLFSFKGDLVLDPFVGVGTTCVVAKQNGRSFVGIDTSSKYCETARSRLAEVLL
ncbi:MAG: site-specific DNA-methyltransferase [Gammaproteobacteria bacterium]|nr:site-specific DNA-methyltransferase [Gammaproteobacteria bacterium]MDE0251573.1 site-specific DNA-methyltransferase [Gammaproteobacteria bacterium]MDE0403417.1 site-specific DNA-methyltransferase [Gammaproteobacteria bacterium]